MCRRQLCEAQVGVHVAKVGGECVGVEVDGVGDGGCRVDVVLRGGARKEAEPRRAYFLQASPFLFHFLKFSLRLYDARDMSKTSLDMASSVLASKSRSLCVLMRPLYPGGSREYFL